MNAIATLPPEVADYLDRVRAALADVPAEERDEMLADLEVSLLEGAEDSLEPPEARLGPPERFAQELRAAAGLTTQPPLASRGLREHLRAFAATPRARAAQETARELAPVWWVARGYVAACALALLAGFNWSDNWSFLPVRGHALGGMLLVLAGMTASVWLGLRARRDARLRRRRRLAALNVVVGILALPIGVQAMEGGESYVTEAYYEPVPAAALDRFNINGDPVENIYPYSRDGKLLLDVLLYDESGNPLQVGPTDAQQDPLRRYLYTRSGEPVLHAFPIRYFEPGSTEVARPMAGPDVDLPQIKTPPLKVKRP